MSADLITTQQYEKPTVQQPLDTGILQGVHFTMPAEHCDWFIEKIYAWFEGRHEVILVDSGVSEKQGTGFIVMEWDGYAIDELFLAILRDEEMIYDFAVYDREEE